MSVTTPVPIGLLGTQTLIYTLTSTPEEIFGGPLPAGRHMIVFADASILDNIGSIDLVVVPGKRPKIVSSSDNCILSTTDGSSFGYMYGDSLITIDYDYITSIMTMSATPSASTIIAKEFLIPMTYAGPNIYNIDTLSANNPADGSPITFESPIIQGYTGANSVNLGQATVTQTTSSTTAVTVNSASGIITTVALTTGSGSVESFQVNNTTVSATSVVVVSVCGYSGSVPPPIVSVSSISAGSFQVNIYNCGSSSLDSGVLKISFMCC